MSVRIGDESVRVTYAHNIWTDGRTAALALTVALAALMVIAAIYAIIPLKDLGFTTFGWGLIGGAAGIVGLNISLVLIWMRQSRPSFKLDTTQFSSLHRFQNKILAYDFYAFTEDGLPFVTFFQKKGDDKQFLVMCDNHLSETHLSKLEKTHSYTPSRHL